MTLLFDGNILTDDRDCRCALYDMSIRANRKLNRYTTLPVLLDLLRRKKLVLLDPSTWEDKNDAQVILGYKKKKKASKLFAICFSAGSETVHHWKAYANGISGCCIEFDRNKLLSAFRGKSGFRWGDVEYKKVRDVEKMTIKLDRMPFIKRWPYRYEHEFRILWEGKAEHAMVDIDLYSIRKITINQEMPPDVFDSIKELLRNAIKGQPKKMIKINRSTLYENKRWVKAVTR